MNDDTATGETRPISVSCDWCGRSLEGRLRRGQLGRMVVVTAPHSDAAGRPCSGSGRTIGTWPVRVEVRVQGTAFEIVIGGGRPRALSTREEIAAALVGLGLERGVAEVWAAAVDSGQPVTLEVPERRQSPRAKNAPEG